MSSQTRLRRTLFAAALAMACAAAPALAQPLGQTRFSARPLGQTLQLDYAWNDRTGAHALGFRLDAAAVAAARAGFRAYRRAELQAAADAELKRQMARAIGDLERVYPGLSIEMGADLTLRSRIAPPADFQTRQREIFDAEMDREIAAIEADYPGVHIVRDGGSFELEARSNAELAAVERRMQAAQAQANAAIARYAEQANGQAERRAARIGQDIQQEIHAIEARMETFRLAYFRERLYRQDETGGLLPDYARIGELALPGLGPAAAALAAQVRALPVRDGLALALAFVQTIPYDRLNDRANDAGFLPPLAMLADNRGDCDTKSVAFAALAHLLYPEIPSLLILVPQHALLALGIAPAPGDRSIRYLGRDWVLAEPVGPALLPIGEIGEESRAILNRPEAAIPLFH